MAANPPGGRKGGDGQVRLGYLFSSPLVHLKPRYPRGNRREAVEVLDTDEELEMIREQLRKSDREIRLKVAVATPSNLRELLNAGCGMLHYSGHGHQDFLAFESDQDKSCGVMEPLKVDRLKALFQAGGVTTQLVLISSCESELSGKAFVEAGVPHVVAVRLQERVTDQAAELFGRNFYHALIVGGFTVKDAFNIGLSTVNATSEEGDNFLLLPAGGDHDVAIFDTLPPGSFVDESLPLPPMVRCPAARKLFLGKLALQRVVETMVDPHNSYVTITGERGVGKTEVAVQACHYVARRRRFQAIFFAGLPAAVASSEGRLGQGGGVGAGLRPGDVCRMVGVAVGMPPPGPASEEDLLDYLFTYPHTPSRGSDQGVGGVPRAKQVLLVLDGVDALYAGGRGALSRGSLVAVLSGLCCHNGRPLHLLMTSQQSVLRETSMRFRNASEKVFLISPLKGTDPAQLLLDLQPRPLNYTELGVPTGSSHCEVLEALAQHPALERAGGHPGTLHRLAPLLTDHFLDDPQLVLMAERYRAEFTQETGDAATDPEEEPQAPSTTPPPQPFPSTPGAPGRPELVSQGKEIQPPQALSSTTAAGGEGGGEDRAAPRVDLPGLEPEGMMTAQECRVWATAVEAGLRDRGCLLAWVGAVVRTEGWLDDCRAPWSALSAELQNHLCGTLTVPSSGHPVLVYGPYGVGSGHEEWAWRNGHPAAALPASSVAGGSSLDWEGGAGSDPPGE
ncbi:unnamed protein product, partial [Discosporangium mesarthrocarpum]